MRRTKATLIYRRTRNLRAVQLLLGHTKIESTVRYLGVEVDDALEIAEKIVFYKTRAGYRVIRSAAAWNPALPCFPVADPQVIAKGTSCHLCTQVWLRCILIL